MSINTCYVRGTDYLPEDAPRTVDLGNSPIKIMISRLAYECFSARAKESPELQKLERDIIEAEKAVNATERDITNTLMAVFENPTSDVGFDCHATTDSLLELQRLRAELARLDFEAAKACMSLLRSMRAEHRNV